MNPQMDDSQEQGIKHLVISSPEPVLPKVQKVSSLENSLMTPHFHNSGSACPSVAKPTDGLEIVHFLLEA